MLVTKIETLTKTRYKVFIEEEFAFVLYKGELSRYHVEEGKEISSDTLEIIRTQVVLKRAKLRAMHLLNDMDRTESQLREKLLQGNYTQEITEQAVAYVKSFGYINDEEYGRRFVMNRKETKSRKEIKAGLIKKGLGQQEIEQALETYKSDDEQEAVRTILRKKRFDADTADEKERQRMFAYLARKGFSYDTIRQVIQVEDWNA